MEDCPLSNPDNFVKDSSFMVIKPSVAAEVIKHCNLCTNYPHCQPDFQLLPTTGAYSIETLASELGGPEYLNDDEFEEI